jgi:hypothetical protein
VETSELPPKFEEVVAFRGTLTPESDRGCALIAAAYIDSQLKELLEGYFVDDKDCVMELLGKSKPLGSFSARIDICYAMGLLPAEVYRDLHLIRKIRNDFGHNPQPISFSEPAISSRGSELVGTWHTRSENPRGRFCNTVMSVLSWIHVALLGMRKPVPPSRKPVDAPRLKAEFDSVWEVVKTKMAELQPPPSSYQELAEKARELLFEEYVRQFGGQDQRPG